MSKSSFWVDGVAKCTDLAGGAFTELTTDFRGLRVGLAFVLCTLLLLLLLLQRDAMYCYYLLLLLLMRMRALHAKCDTCCGKEAPLGSSHICASMHTRACMHDRALGPVRRHGATSSS
jgi:hypothetical protein